MRWTRAVQKAVVENKVGPTISARAYGMLGTAMYDAWAAYAPKAIATQLADDLQVPAEDNTDANKADAISYSAYRTLVDLFLDQISIFDLPV